MQERSMWQIRGKMENLINNHVFFIWLKTVNSRLYHRQYNYVISLPWTWTWSLVTNLNCRTTRHLQLFSLTLVLDHTPRFTITFSWHETSHTHDMNMIIFMQHHTWSDIDLMPVMGVFTCVASDRLQIWLLYRHLTQTYDYAHAYGYGRRK